MLYSVGYQADDRMKRVVLANRNRVAEIYFPWGGFSTGRGEASGGWDAQRRLEDDLVDYAAAGVALVWLLNANCYGRDAQSRRFFQSIGDVADRLRERYGLAGVTTASPLIARFLKENFPELENRASVNMEIGNPEGAEYLAPHFDGFYWKREFNYDRERLAAMRTWCRAHGKKLYLLANSGCLNFCPVRTFHDNLVAHEHEIAGMDNGYGFVGVCHDFLREPERRAGWLDRSNAIRPEDVAHFEGLCDGMKLATRVHRNPALVVSAYVAGRFDGNLPELTEPSHAEHFLPYIVANDRLPADYAARRFAGGSCVAMQENATIRLEEHGIFDHADQ